MIRTSLAIAAAFAPGQLVAAGTDIDTADQYGRTALMDASEQGDSTVVSWLIANHAQVNGRDAPRHADAHHRADEDVRRGNRHARS